MAKANNPWPKAGLTEALSATALRSSSGVASGFCALISANPGT